MFNCCLKGQDFKNYSKKFFFISKIKKKTKTEYEYENVRKHDDVNHINIVM